MPEEKEKEEELVDYNNFVIGDSIPDPLNIAPIVDEKEKSKEELETEAERLASEDKETEAEKLIREEQEASEIEAAKKEELLENETDEEKAARLEAEEDDNEDETSNPFTTMIEAIHDHNGFEFNAEEFKDKGDMDGLMEFIGDIVKDNSVPTYASDQSRKFDEFIAKYGEDKASDFLKANFGPKDYDKVDINNIDQSKNLMRDYLKSTTKYSDTKIEKEIKKSEDLGEFEETEELQEMKDHMIKHVEETKTAVEERAESEKKKAYEDYQDHLIEQKKRIDSKDKIAGFEIKAKDKDALYKFGYEVGKDGFTPYQRMRKDDKDLDLKLLMLAFKGIDKEKISKSVNSDLSKKLQKDMSRFTDKKVQSKGSGTQAPKKINPNEEVNYDDFVLGK